MKLRIVALAILVCVLWGCSSDSPSCPHCGDPGPSYDYMTPQLPPPPPAPSHY